MKWSDVQWGEVEVNKLSMMWTETPFIFSYGKEARRPRTPQTEKKSSRNIKRDIKGVLLSAPLECYVFLRSFYFSY